MLPRELPSVNVDFTIIGPDGEVVEAKTIPFDLVSGKTLTKTVKWRVPSGAKQGYYAIKYEIKGITSTMARNVIRVLGERPTLPVIAPQELLPSVEPALGVVREEVEEVLELKLSPPIVTKPEYTPGETVHIVLPFFNSGPPVSVELTTHLLGATEVPKTQTVTIGSGDTTKIVTWEVPANARAGSYTLQVWVREPKTGAMLASGSFPVFSVPVPTVTREWREVVPALKRVGIEEIKRRQEAEAAKVERQVAAEITRIEGERAKAEREIERTREKAEAAEAKIVREAARAEEKALEGLEASREKAHAEWLAAQKKLQDAKLPSREELRSRAFQPIKDQLLETRHILSRVSREDPDPATYIGGKYQFLYDELGHLTEAVGELEAGDVPLSRLDITLRSLSASLTKLNSAIADYRPDTSRNILRVIWRLLKRYVRG